MTAATRADLVAAARSMNAAGINSGTSGNLSVRRGEGMLITPSGQPYERMGPEDIVAVDAQGQWPRHQQPSSEWRFHLAIYRARPEAAAVVHAHPVHCAALACLRRPIPAFHYMVAVAGGSDIRCAPYATFGTEALSVSVVQALEGRKACLMANHGLVCLERSMEQALALAVEVENLARMYCQCLALGEPALLGEDEMARVLEKFKHYGWSGTARE